MKSSRALLLAALMTVAAPVFMFASESNTDNKPNQVQQNPVNPSVEPGILSKIGSGTYAVAAFLPITAPDWVAENTLRKIAAMDCIKDTKIAAVLNNPWFGGLAVYALVASILLKLNQLNQQAQDDTDNQLMFEDENNF